MIFKREDINLRVKSVVFSRCKDMPYISNGAGRGHLAKMAL